MVQEILSQQKGATQTIYFLTKQWIGVNQRHPSLIQSLLHPVLRTRKMMKCRMKRGINCWMFIFSERVEFLRTDKCFISMETYNSRTRCQHRIENIYFEDHLNNLFTTTIFSAVKTILIGPKMFSLLPPIRVNNINAFATIYFARHIQNFWLARGW